MIIKKKSAIPLLLFKIKNWRSESFIEEQH